MKRTQTYCTYIIRDVYVPSPFLNPYRGSLMASLTINLAFFGFPSCWKALEDALQSLPPPEVQEKKHVDANGCFSIVMLVFPRKMLVGR